MGVLFHLFLGTPLGECFCLIFGGCIALLSGVTFTQNFKEHIEWARRTIRIQVTSVALRHLKTILCLRGKSHIDSSRT